MEKVEFVVFIGRFQPFHNAHLHIINHSLKLAKKVVVVIGSYRCSTTHKNPFTFEERGHLILKSLDPQDRDRVTIVPHRDNMYDDDSWIVGLQHAIRQVTGDSKSVHLIGHFKDDTSYYLKFFPQWGLYEEPNYKGINATDIRAVLYEQPEKIGELTTVPDNVKISLEQYTQTEHYKNLQIDYKYCKEYRASLEAFKYPINLVTVDAVVIQSGHVLLVERGRNPGKGKYALPGGFLNQNERIFDGAIRELKEETNIKANRGYLKRVLAGEHVFDHPKRSLRGRIVTHAFCFRFDENGPLPEVKGSDDAKRAFWMPFNDLVVNEENFFEDHLYMIQYFINRT